mmetsp:Transcript_6597/g.8647  ORF Transcript_6597/g.8647 Transcript_6597/m.8647 type:complete len:389 (+) Transcript_6597:532-1698(+)
MTESQQQQQQQRARILLIGSGRMGQIRMAHLHANPRFQVCGVVDVNLAGAQKLAGKYFVPSFSSLTEAIDYYSNGSILTTALKPTTEDIASVASTDVSVASASDGGDNTNKAGGGIDSATTSLDAILISTPTFTHAGLIEEAIRSKLAIFTEKPVDETADKIIELFEKCAAAKIPLACGFQRRFDPSYVALREAIRRREIGKPLMANIFFGDYPCPPIEFLLKGGNLWMDLLCHDADFIRWCLDDEVESVYATGTSSVPQLEKAGVHDNGTVLLKFKKGAVVTVSMSRSAAYGYDQRCEVFGELGHVKVANHSLTSTVLSDRNGVHSSTLQPGFKQRFSEAFAAELDAFADVVLDGAAWPISARDCVAAQEMADAANTSCKEGRSITF